MSIVINLMLPDKQELAENMFVTIMFDHILKSSCKDFIKNFKQAKSDWIKNPKKFDCVSAMIDFTNLYTRYISTGHWYKTDANTDMIIYLVTTLNKERNKNILRFPKTPDTPRDGRPGLEISKFENVGKFKTVGGVNHVFCTDHGRKYDKGSSVMYIPLPHDYPELLASKQKKQAAWK